MTSSWLCMVIVNCCCAVSYCCPEMCFVLLSVCECDSSEGVLDLTACIGWASDSCCDDGIVCTWGLGVVLECRYTAVDMCIYACVCMYVCMYFYMFVCMFVYMCLCMYVYMFVCICVIICVCMYVCVHVCMFILRVYVCMCAHVCAHVCIQAWLDFP